MKQDKVVKISFNVIQQYPNRSMYGIFTNMYDNIYVYIYNMLNRFRYINIPYIECLHRYLTSLKSCFTFGCFFNW